MRTLAQTYLQNLQSVFRGDARELTYRNALQEFVVSLGNAFGKTLAAKSELARLKGNIAPDLTIEERGASIGWIETKDLAVNLDNAEQTDQLFVYKKQLRNLILTNYLEFRWFVAGEEKLRATLIERRDGDLSLLEENIDAVASLFEQFFRAEQPTIDSPKSLAERMASIAKLIRQAAFKTVQDDPESPLNAMLADMRLTLAPNLDAEDFADMYAQTVAYGLFAAWLNSDQPKAFSPELAFKSVPATSPFLKKFFTFLSTVERLDAIQWILDDLARLFKATDLKSVLQNFGKGTMQLDPVVHFYETFLAAYDRETRKDRGVFYTPEPVVSFIVRSVDALLQSRFEKPNGLCDEHAIILDPATGTGTFLYAVVTRIYERRNGAFWSEYVEENLLPRLFGFELMMAPYAIAHLKLLIHLRELGYQPRRNAPIGVYLTNALDPAVRAKDTLGFGQFIVEEAEKAAEVKEEKKVMVVLGNPPYKGSSLNPSEIETIDPKTQKPRKEKTYIGRLIEDYKVVDGRKLEERNPKWLQDDYVKFIRIGQKRIEQTGYGILAFITNNGFIDNPTFRGMRQALMNAFDEIYVLDLHGSAKKQEKAPDGSKDENVFPIQQGVCISLFVKREKKRSKPAKVFHAELFGRREAKFEFLLRSDVKKIKWTRLAPASPMYYFVPKDESALNRYNSFWSVKEIFPVNSVGIVTSRDHFAIAFTREEMERRIKKFRNPSFTDRQVASEFNLKNTSSFSLEKARKTLLADKNWKEKILPILYRPFDIRFVIYDATILERSRLEVMKNMLKENLGLIATRQVNGKFRHVGVAKTLVESCAISSKTKEINYVFPLYVYEPAQNGADLDDVALEKKPNLNPKFVAELEAKIGARATPEKIFRYIYATLHSPKYRARYEEFLKSDFPRVPLPKNKKQFDALAKFGEALIDLHLLAPKKFAKTKLTLSGEGVEDEKNRVVEKPAFDEKRERLYVNGRVYFERVEKAVWEFEIGGYQALRKWLLEREGEALRLSDAETLQRIIVALRETLDLIEKIDEAS